MSDKVDSGQVRSGLVSSLQVRSYEVMSGLVLFSDK